MPDSGTPPWPPEAPQPPIAEAAPAESPSKKRPAWFGWVAGVGVVVVAAAAFFVAKSAAGGGSSSPAGATTNSSTPGNGSGQRGGSLGRFPGTAGEISAISGTTLTVQDRQGQSVKVTTTDGTRFTTEKTVAVSDIAKGDRVSVNGTQSGTSIAATPRHDRRSASDAPRQRFPGRRRRRATDRRVARVRRAASVPVRPPLTRTVIPPASETATAMAGRRAGLRSARSPRSTGTRSRSRASTVQP